MTEKDEQNYPEEFKEREVANDSVEIICSNCGGKNPTGHFFCGKCGRSLVEKLICSRCQSEMPVFSTFCGKCGASLKFIDKSKQSYPQIEKPITSIYTQQPYALTPEQQQILLYQQQKTNIESRKNTAKIFGILSIILAAFGFVFLIIEMIVLSSDTFEQTLIDLGFEDILNIAQIYAIMLGFFLPPVIILAVSGITLIKPKQEDKPWKSLYLVLRVCFIAFTSFTIIISFVSSFGWVFYNPPNINTSDQAIWLFYIFQIPSGIKISNLYLILFSIYSLCVISLVIPTLIQIVKKKRENYDKSSIIEEKTSEQNILGKIKQDTSPNQMIYFSSRKEQFRAMYERKGPMPSIFYKIKNTPLIKSMELLCASYVVSIIISLILSPLAEEDTSGGVTYDPFEYLIQVTWAGVFEELSFRLVLIGVPMILVISVRLYIQTLKKKTKFEDNSIIESKINGKNLATKKQKLFLLQNEAKLSYKDVLLALRGKYKIIGIPEWVLVGISSILFGFAHWKGWTGGWGAWKIIQAGIMGLFLSYAFVKYGIESSIFIHITNNLIASLVIMTYEIPQASWIAFFASILIPVFLVVGVMKATSWVINLVYRFRIIKYPQINA
ncbi:MAG: CPBP family intramembrane metalloprotease [Candidatus Heimdallarchaeota archaeon]|nr:CPBP family intramembrane metalloprotease [Candidatus Heimdallarchaeota archaeon]